METDHKIACAIEFGTLFSGYSFSSVSDFERNPMMVYMKSWCNCTSVTKKIPTCVLIKPDGKTLHSFGYEAENKYVQLAEETKHNSYYFFKRFRQALDKKLREKSSSTITLEDEMGRSLPAVDIIAMSIRYFVDDMMETCLGHLEDIQKKDILWVLTVPAVWSDGGKQLMQKAAIRADVGRNHHSIVTESETILIFLQYLQNEKSKDQIDVSGALYKFGTKYMILDAGDSSVDITVNEIDKTGKVKVVHTQRFVECGGSKVDDACEDMLTTIFSKKVYLKFTEKQGEDWLELSRDIECKKINVSPARDSSVTIRIPKSLLDIYKNDMDEKIADRLSKSDLCGEIKILSDRMRISAKVFKSLYNKSMQKVIGYVKEILRERHVTYIVMIGGYSDTPMLQDAVKAAFPDIHVIIPEEPSLAVLKGAVICGHSQRKSNTHGVIDGSDFLSSLTDGSDFIYDICCTPCSDDDKNVEAEYHCEKCQIYFCFTCVTHHNKIFKNHKLLAKSEQGFSKYAKQ